MYCSRCGTVYPQNYRICPTCGSPLIPEQPAQNMASGYGANAPYGVPRPVYTGSSGTGLYGRWRAKNAVAVIAGILALISFVAILIQGIVLTRYTSGPAGVIYILRSILVCLPMFALCMLASRISSGLLSIPKFIGLFFSMISFVLITLNNGMISLQYILTELLALVFAVVYILVVFRVIKNKPAGLVLMIVPAVILCFLSLVSIVQVVGAGIPMLTVTQILYALTDILSYAMFTAAGAAVLAGRYEGVVDVSPVPPYGYRPN